MAELTALEEARLSDGWQRHGSISVCPACACQPFVHAETCPLPTMLAAAKAEAVVEQTKIMLLSGECPTCHHNVMAEEVT